MRIKRIVKDGELLLFSGDEQVLSIRETNSEKTFCIALTGSLRSDTAHELQDELQALSIMGFDLRVDMEKVDYISSACAEVFLKIQLDLDSRGRGSLTLFNVPAPILKELNSTGMTELLMIE